MNYIVLDLEFNQAFPFKSGKKVEPNPECPFDYNSQYSHY